MVEQEHKYAVHRHADAGGSKGWVIAVVVLLLLAVVAWLVLGSAPQDGVRTDAPAAQTGEVAPAAPAEPAAPEAPAVNN